MIFRCPICSIECNITALPVNCCGQSHAVDSPALREGELPARQRKSTGKTSGTQFVECKHREARTRRVECLPCGGKQVQIYGCGQRGECTLANPIAGIATCTTCPAEIRERPLIVSLVWEGAR